MSGDFQATLYMDSRSAAKLRQFHEQIGSLHRGESSGGGIVCACKARFASFGDWSEHVQKLCDAWTRAAVDNALERRMVAR